MNTGGKFEMTGKVRVVGKNVEMSAHSWKVPISKIKIYLICKPNS